MNISFIIPCYNENPKTLHAIIDKLISVLNQVSNLTYEILVINDGSKKYSYSKYNAINVKLISHKYNKGYGMSILTGISTAKHEWIGIVDADNTYPVQSFGELIAYCGDYDMVVGARNWKDMPLTKRFAKYTLNKLVNYLTEKNIPDINSGMRLFRKTIAKQYIEFFPKRFSFTSTITMICLTNGYNVKFADIAYSKRAGLSNIHPIKDMIKFVALILKLGLYFAPLRFFTLLSFTVGSCAVAKEISDLMIINSIGNFAIVLYFLTFQLFFLGFIADMLKKRKISQAP